MTKRRWMSVWHQVDEVMSAGCSNILEIGPGPGLFKSVAQTFGLEVLTLDVDPALSPDYLGSPTDLPFGDDSFEITCAFEVLEHLPFEESLRALGEMIRTASKHVVVSLPDAKTMWPFSFHVPKIGDKKLLIPKPGFRRKHRGSDREHFWEINMQGFELRRLTEKFDGLNGVSLTKTYRVPENPYHRFFVFDICDQRS